MDTQSNSEALPPTTCSDSFAVWYEGRFGITVEHAERAQVCDLAVLSEAFNAGFQTRSSGSDSVPCCPSSFAPGCRVKVVSGSTYKGRYGTITEANGMPDRWFVAIDDDELYDEVSFYAIELAYIPLANSESSRPASVDNPSPVE